MTADEQIANELLRIDRSLWRTLSCIKIKCKEIYDDLKDTGNDFIGYTFKNEVLANLCQETILAIEKEQGDIADEHRYIENQETKQLFTWLGEGTSQ